MKMSQHDTFIMAHAMMSHTFAGTMDPKMLQLRCMWPHTALTSSNFIQQTFFKCASDTVFVSQDEDQAVSQMRKMLEPFMLRRLKEDVATQLVPKQHEVALLELTESQAQLYEEAVATFRKDLLSSGDHPG